MTSSIQESNHSNNLKTQFSKEYQELHIRPWMRFFARHIDICAFGFTVGIVSALLYPSLISDIANYLVILFFWFIFEPIVLYFCGTTLGKFLLNIKLTNLNGERLKIVDTYKRSFGVWVVGLGFGVPIVSLITLVSAYIKLNDTGTTYWDKNNFIVTHGNVSFLKGLVALLIGVLFIGFSIYDNSKQLNYHSLISYVAKVENIKLPIMVDDETELNKIYLDKNILTYQCRLINVDKDNINEELLFEHAKNKILEKVCDKSISGPILSLGYNLSFKYSDKNNNPLGEIVIKPSDCEKK